MGTVSISRSSASSSTVSEKEAPSSIIDVSLTGTGGAKTTVKDITFVVRATCVSDSDTRTRVI